MLKRLSLLLIMLLASPGQVQAALVSETVACKDGATSLEGYLVWDDSIQGKRPGVIVVHGWWGLNDYARQRADQLAGLGCVAFAIDMYGDGKVTEHGDEASSWMKQITANVEGRQQRAALGHADT